MSITIHLPPEAEQAFREAWGDDLDRKGLEAMVIEGYREQKLSVGKAAQLLGFATTYEADKWFADHGVPLNYSMDDLDEDARTLANLRKTKR